MKSLNNNGEAKHTKVRIKAPLKTSYTNKATKRCVSISEWTRNAIDDKMFVDGLLGV